MPRSYAALQSALLAWFDAHHRPLPFRESRDPYRIWVSEVMLQQTTVAAVVPYFQRFIARFPTVRDLAEAEEADVLRLWEGLGYYRRARHLHAAARILVRDHGGTLPDDQAVWAELPGVGRYILGAVLSQAFNRKLPIVEANSLRVLTRWFGYRDDPRTSAGQAWLWSKAAEILPARRIGDFNQAMMELGALVCTPGSPNCNACPIRRGCVARKHELQTLIPPKPRPPEPVKVREVAIAIRRGPRFLFGQRPDHSRWAGMWELPHGELQSRESMTDAIHRIARELTGVHVDVGPRFGTVRHTVTRFQISMTAFTATYASGRPRSQFYRQLRWLRLDQLAELPTSIPQRSLWERLAEAV